jgi:hypothetical protein
MLMHPAFRSLHGVDIGELSPLAFWPGGFPVKAQGSYLPLLPWQEAVLPEVDG